MTQPLESQQQYGSILTILGENAEQNGKLQNKQITFTHMAIGDANDQYVQPNRKQTSLINELARIPINSVDVLQPTPDSVPMLKVEAILPDDVNDLIIREFAAVATFDGNSYFHAVGTCARIYVPAPINNGNVSTPVTLEMIFVITSADPIVEIDPNVVTASRAWVNQQIPEKKYPVHTSSSERSNKERFEGRIDVADFGAVGDEIADDTIALNAAADKSRETGKQLWSESGKRYKTTSTVNFRYIPLDFDATVVGYHNEIVVELGGNASSRNNPRQYLFTGGRNGGATDIPSVRVMGMKGQEISVDHSDYLQIYADVNEGRAVNYSCAYSRMYLKYIRKLELNTGERTKSDFPWINENHFYLTSVMDIVIDGAYEHNNNKFYGGTLEGDSSSLEVIKGWQNYFYDLRFEGSPTVHFHAGTWRNFVEYTWISSPSKLPAGTSANIIDEGEMNTISDVHDRAMTRYPILSITPNNLLFDAESGLHNIAGVKGITIDKTLQTLSASSWTQIFVSDYLPVSPSADSLMSVTAAGVTEGGFRVTFEAYDENFVKIVPAESQVVYPGIGNKPFAEDITRGASEAHWPEVSNYRNLTAYFTRNSNARYVRLSVIAAASGITFKMLSISIRNKTSSPDWNNVMPACNAPIFIPKVG
ncbi:TPA: phage tail protein [Vibrio cholerae]|nr:phage tail protein [Vibrio cholerae]